MGTTALVAVALAGTFTLVEVAAPAYAEGGKGGANGGTGTGGRGGADSATSAGSTPPEGTDGGGGGGGGAGSTGGNGADGANDSCCSSGGGTGGYGGTTYGANGGDASNDASDAGGGGGGGGGAHGFVGNTFASSTVATGGYGGRGGTGSGARFRDGGGGGGGGGGGYGAVVTGSGSLSLEFGIITGGRGGYGGLGGGYSNGLTGGVGGHGGSGGLGLLLLGGTGQVNMSYTSITGGHGGYGGKGGSFYLAPNTYYANSGSGGKGGIGLLSTGARQMMVSDSFITGGGGGNGYGKYRKVGDDDYAGSSGGDGGAAVVFSSGALTFNRHVRVGGGNGGNGTFNGNGGAGGAGVTLGDDASFINHALITGGSGGIGGPGDGRAPTSSGAGGSGVVLGHGAFLANEVHGTIRGGHGGNRGTPSGGKPGTSGDGGTGVVLGSGAEVTNSGRIHGGTGGSGPFPGHGGTGVELGSGARVTNSGWIYGGTGGSGIYSARGGTGVSLGGGTLTNTGTITGGTGGTGTNGGTGGTGVSLGGGTLTNTGTITGGNGGQSTDTYGSGASGVAANGGTVINSGTIVGGNGVSGLANAITFTGGENMLELRQGTNIQGYVDATSGNNDTLALGGTANGTFYAGLITSPSASGYGGRYGGFENFEKTGSSTWTLTGAPQPGATFTPWTISEGTLSISRDDSLGDASDGLTFDGGTLENTAAFSMTRDITLDAGGGTFNTAADLTASGVISGPGALTKAGDGRLTLTGDNTYAGGTTIAAGTLRIGDGRTSGSIAGNVANNGTLAFDRSNDLSFAGVVSGSGALTKFGAGRLTLTGNNTYTGGTTIAAGTLRIGNGGTSGSIRGNVANNGALAFDRSDDLTYDGAVSGNGALAKFGPGQLTLTGTSTYTGATTINAGTLRVDGALGPGAVGVASGATLAGSGRLGGAVSVQNGGTLKGARGSTLGMGALALGPGSTVDVRLGAPSKKLFDVGGNLTLDGTLDIEGEQGFRTGVYRLFEYGTLTDNDMTIGSRPSGFKTSINTRSPHHVNLTVFADPTGTQFWQGLVGGGSGTWSATSTDWVNADGSMSTRWGERQGIFEANPGTVTVEGTQAFTSLEFVVDGYTLVAGHGGALAPTGLAELWAEGEGTTATIVTPIIGSGGIAKIGAGTIVLSAANSYSGGTTIEAGTLSVSADANLGAASGGLAFNGGTLQNTAAFTTARTVSLGTGGGTFDTAADLTAAGIISGAGALTKIGSGTLTLTGANSYSGGTTIDGGTLSVASDSNLGAASGSLTMNGGTLESTSAFTTARAITLDLGGGALNTEADLTASGVISGSGALAKLGAGRLTLTGTNSYTGTTTVNSGALIVNGSIAASSVLTVDPDGLVGGSGLLPSTAINGGTLAPGNSIGTLSTIGNFTQNGGAYEVEVSPAGQSDRLDVGGTATLNGGTVQLQAAQGSYPNSTTYTILHAEGGVTGAYNPSVTEDFAFLTPSLSYDADDVFLTLALQQNAFSFGGITPNEKAVGFALDRSFVNASGDFATVIGALEGLSTAQGPRALNTISGQPWADFGSMNVANNALFMNAVGQQMAVARGAQAGGQRQALAQACDVAACDVSGPGPWSAWLSGLGGLGSVLGDGNASTFTYNLGGAAVGLDYRFDPRFLLGVSVGYTHGTQWVNGFLGQGWSDSVSVAAYGSFTQAGFYVDALAGYAWSSNQLERQIAIPGLAQRTANGSTVANQFLGQVEAGYEIDIYAPAQASLTPFARLQMSSVTQNGFSESGAGSLSLEVAEQGTNSLRSTIGAELAGELPLGHDNKLDLAVRLGWMHEYSDTTRPISAAFAGAPGNGFTVYGAPPARDSAVVGFSASTAVADATSLYLRYDGEVGGGTDNHALNIGLRMTW